MTGAAASKVSPGGCHPPLPGMAGDEPPAEQSPATRRGRPG